MSISGCSCTVEWHQGSPEADGRYHVIVDHGPYRKRMRLWWSGQTGWMYKDSGKIIFWTSDQPDPDGDYLYM